MNSKDHKVQELMNQLDNTSSHTHGRLFTDDEKYLLYYIESLEMELDNVLECLRYMRKEAIQ